MKEFIQSKTFKLITVIVGIFLVAIVSFGTGVAVGLKKARYSYEWGANYERNFIGAPRIMNGGRGGFFSGMMREFDGRDFRNANGLAGTIVSISGNNIVVKDSNSGNGQENTIAITGNTIIKSRGTNLKLSDLKQNDKIVVLGKPSDNGVINADLIRVFNGNNNNGVTNSNNTNQKN